MDDSLEGRSSHQATVGDTSNIVSATATAATASSYANSKLTVT